MAFKPSAAGVDPVIQTAVAVTANMVGQTVECDTTAAAFTVSLPDAAIDGADFTVNWKAGANALTIGTVTTANYKLIDDSGALANSMVMSVLGESVTFRFSRSSPTAGSFVRV